MTHPCPQPPSPSPRILYQGSAATPANAWTYYASTPPPPYTSERLISSTIVHEELLTDYLPPHQPVRYVEIPVYEEVVRTVPRKPDYCVVEHHHRPIYNAQPPPSFEIAPSTAGSQVSTRMLPADQRFAGPVPEQVPAYAVDAERKLENSTLVEQEEDEDVAQQPRFIPYAAPTRTTCQTTLTTQGGGGSVSAYSAPQCCSGASPFVSHQSCCCCCPYNKRSLPNATTTVTSTTWPRPAFPTTPITRSSVPLGKRLDIPGLKKIIKPCALPQHGGITTQSTQLDDSASTADVYQITYPVSRKCEIPKCLEASPPVSGVVLAQSLHPIIRESDTEVLEVEMREFNPYLVPVDVMVPRPVARQLIATERRDYHKRIAISEIPPEQLNLVLAAGETQQELI